MPVTLPLNEIVLGDCLEVLRGWPDACVDAVVTDPPYGLSFMGKKWDYDVPSVDIWREVMRVLKPGGRLLAFSGARTYHRMAVNIEDAGFVIEDQIMWLYGSGFPKHGSKLKPAHEPIVVARKGPVSLLNIDAARIEIGPLDREQMQGRSGTPSQTSTSVGNWLNNSNARFWEPAAGRWPANVVLDEEAAALLDEQSGECKSGVIKPRRVEKPTHAGTSFPSGARSTDRYFGGDTGGASRFFMRCTSDCPICLGPKHDIMSAWQAVCSADAPSLDGLGNDSAGALAPQSQQQSSADRAESSNTDVPPAVITSMTSLATRAATVLPNAAMQTAQRTAQLVKSAGSLCDSCAIGIALSLAAMQRGLDPESLHGLDSIFAPRRQTLYRCLALLAASLPSTDTTPTTASLSMWFGCVRDAMQSSTLDAETVGESDRTRFRYQSKASRSERNAGCEGLPTHEVKLPGKATGFNPETGEVTDGYTGARQNHHPTVKPVALMRWLIRLVTQPGGLVLDPFGGSGTTGIAAQQEGRDWILIERDPEYCAIAKARTARPPFRDASLFDTMEAAR